MILNTIKYIFFIFHLLGIFTVTIGWLYDFRILYIQSIVILSWKLNNNQCLLTQIEYKLFHSTLIGNGQKFVVPTRHRYILYINFLLGILYYCCVQFDSCLLFSLFCFSL